MREAGYDVALIDVTDDLPALLTALTPKPDAVFNALHGRFGEDGAIQGVLDWVGIPYTHSGVRASAIAMDKQVSKAMFSAAGLPVPKARSFRSTICWPPIQCRCRVIKPVSEGSSVGVESSARATTAATRWLRPGGRPVAMVEEFIPGRELTVSVMGDRALAVTDIIADAGTFYDYSKYADGGSHHIIPAEIHPDIYARAWMSLSGAQGYRLPRRHPLRLPLR